VRPLARPHGRPSGEEPSIKNGGVKRRHGKGKDDGDRKGKPVMVAVVSLHTVHSLVLWFAAVPLGVGFNVAVFDTRTSIMFAWLVCARRMAGRLWSGARAAPNGRLSEVPRLGVVLRRDLARLNFAADFDFGNALVKGDIAVHADDHCFALARCVVVRGVSAIGVFPDIRHGLVLWLPAPRALLDLM